MPIEKSKRAVVMIPTCNEADNIGRLVEEIHAIVPKLDMLVVDDQSPDGTADVVRQQQKIIPNLDLMVRSGPRGRGIAGIEGFRKCLERGYDFILEMDADFSHHPRFLPDFLDDIRYNDVVLGSRFILGGEDRDRGWIRTLITMFANTYIRFWLNIHIRDCTSGYRAFRREVLERIDLQSTISTGPSVVQELLYKAVLSGFTVREIPIVFVDRKRGRSSFNRRIALQGFIMILRLRYLFSKRDNRGIRHD